VIVKEVLFLPSTGIESLDSVSNEKMKEKRSFNETMNK
jgi:hypothetical protein